MYTHYVHALCTAYSLYSVYHTHESEGARVKETAAAVEGPQARMAALEAQLAAIHMRERRLYGEV